MGLFGGFKAKFTRNSTDKQKSNEVVCLRYHVISEFDRQDGPERVPSTVRPDLRKNEVIRKSSGSKTRPSIINSKGTIFENGSTPSEPSAAISKTKSMTNVNVSEGNSSVSAESIKSSSKKSKTAKQKVSTPGEPTAVISKTKSMPNVNVSEENSSAESIKSDSKKSKPAKQKAKSKSNEPPPKNIVSTSRNPLSQIKTNENNNKNNNNTSKSTGDLTYSTSVIVPITTNAASLTVFNTTFDQQVKENQGDQIEEVTIQTNERSVVLNGTGRNEKQSRSILKTKTAYEETGEHVFDRYQDQSPLIFNRSHDSVTHTTSSFSTFKSVESERRTPDFDYATLSLSKTQTYSDNDTASIKTNEDDYKINIVQHDVKYYHGNDYSEDEMSHDDEYDNHRDLVTESSDYSSQAASIFFGGDEVEVVRPRNIKLNEEDAGGKEERRRSSADC